MFDNVTREAIDMRNMVKAMVPTGIIRVLVIIALCCFICPHVAADNEAYTMSDNNSDISVEIEGTFGISLESNPTTGYEWNITECDYSILELVNTSYESAGNQTPPVVGAGGSRNWTFMGLKDGETALKLVYLRSWEGEDSAANEYLLHITVGNTTVKNMTIAVTPTTPEVTVTQSADSTPSATQSPAPTQKKDAPCFEAVFAIAGLLAVAYLIRRKD
ncbi:MAG: protease inhibitor I42 family protein [Euryarchaeota archaeon]|nr:protease inhibitor I42 family protein [Euryarchaeota archaeon]